MLGQNQVISSARWVCLGLILFLLNVCLASAAHYIEIRSRVANIRSAPRTGARIVTKARRNDVFQVDDEQGNWYTIQLFSAASRYVHKSVAKPTTFISKLPPESSVRRDIFQAWMEAQKRAQEEADRTHPPVKNLRRNIQRKHLLNDRYKLKVMHDFQLPPASYRRIILEGNRRGW